MQERGTPCPPHGILDIFLQGTTEAIECCLKQKAKTPTVKPKGGSKVILKCCA